MAGKKPMKRNIRSSIAGDSCPVAHNVYHATLWKNDADCASEPFARPCRLQNVWTTSQTTSVRVCYLRRRRAKPISKMVGCGTSTHSDPRP
eukprot:COSAG02_NODE_4024_length_5890_cov_2.925574_7_plen_91_part_00